MPAARPISMELLNRLVSGETESFPLVVALERTGARIHVVRASPDGKGFTGTWGYAHARTGGGSWEGKKPLTAWLSSTAHQSLLVAGPSG
jgi:hypothetical protein